MALDFSQVKEMQIPIVVQPTADWYELSFSSGTTTRYFEDRSYDDKPATMSTFSHTNTGTGNTPRIRIYFTWSGDSNYTYTFKINEETVSSISSPLDITRLTTANTIITIRQINTSHPSGYRELILTTQYYSSYDRVNFKLIGYHGNTSYSDLWGEFRLTITKIEQYYLPDPTPIIVNKEVKKIEDSNSNILWASDDAYPYRLLDYVNIPADAYINLYNEGGNFVGTKLDINFNPLGLSSQQGSSNLFGAIYYNGSTYYRYHMTTTSNGLIQVWYGTGNSAYKDSGIYSNDTSRHVIDLNYTTANKLYVDDVDKGTYSTPSSTGTGNLYLGARRFNNNGTIQINNYSRTIRVYSIETKLSTGTSIFYPVQRKSDGVVGFLKVYNNGEATRFISSETSTSLVAGNVVEEYWDRDAFPYELYEGYYLTSHSYNKDTNYIDLGIKWNNNWKLEGKFYKPTTISQWGRLLGTGYDTNREVYVNYDSDYNGNFVVNYGNTYASSYSYATTINTEYNFSFGNRGSSCECWFKRPDSQWTSFGTAWSPSNTDSTYNLRLFSNSQGDRDGIYGIGKIQINEPSDLWSEDGALMLLVPARRKSDGVLGMYDKNNDVFYPVTTSGDGYFTITDVNGNVIN